MAKKVFIVQYFSKVEGEWVQSVGNQKEFTSLEAAQVAAKDAEKAVFGMVYRAIEKP